MQKEKTDNCEQYRNIELGNLLFGHSRGSYPVDREMAQPLFARFFDRFGIDSYGYVNAGSSLSGTSKEEGEMYTSVDTDVFSIHPYYWVDNEKAEDAPDFFYKPEGIEIRWYKYAMRDAYSNIPLTKEKIIDILKKCAESAVKYGSST